MSGYVNGITVLIRDWSFNTSESGEQLSILFISSVSSHQLVYLTLTDKCGFVVCYSCFKYHRRRLSRQSQVRIRPYVDALALLSMTSNNLWFIAVWCEENNNQLVIYSEIERNSQYNVQIICDRQLIYNISHDQCKYDFFYLMVILTNAKLPTPSKQFFYVQ